MYHFFHPPSDEQLQSKERLFSILPFLSLLREVCECTGVVSVAGATSVGVVSGWW